MPRPGPRHDRRSCRSFARLAAGAVVLALAASPAVAEPLEEALARAYAAEPSLAAQRARLRAVDEQVPQALSGYRPTLQAGLSVGRDLTDTRYADGTRVGTEANPREITLSAGQPVFDATVAPDVRRAESLVDAQRATLLETEQTVLLATATAYLDVLRDQEILELDRNNEKVLTRQLSAARDRRRVGEYTLTDVAQAQSRLAEATATRMAAEGTLETTRAAYARRVGAPPGRLALPRLAVALPETLEAAVAAARADHPSVLAAVHSEAAQRHTVDQRRGALLPTVGVSAEAAHTGDPGPDDGYAVDRADSASLSLRVTVPLYQAGLPEARIREARHTAVRQRLLVDEARRAATESAVTAWESLQTARATIRSYQAQVAAAETALDGVTEEAKVGARTMLDVLDQEQELLNARVGLVAARHDELVAAFELLAATGGLTARRLALPVAVEDPDAHRRAVRGRWTGTDAAG
ncbi:TolC family outer membrane protein [Azospirillum sp. ST 5-10]|uniref:TolC family outer membrane protein n=1 Tax=unclassified Azospirillum TaxID=2630922 RepID=UPI003F4A77D1